MPKNTVEKLWVDPDVCLAHYICVGEAPLVFEQNNDEWTVQVKPGAIGEVLRENTEDLFWAASICPVSAIKLTLETGEVVDADSALLKAFLKSHGQGYNHS